MKHEILEKLKDNILDKKDAGHSFPTENALPKILFYETETGFLHDHLVLGLGKKDVVELSKGFSEYDFGYVYKSPRTKTTFFLVVSGGETLFAEVVEFDPRNLEQSYSLEADAQNLFSQTLLQGDETRDTLLGDKPEDVFDFVFDNEETDRKTYERQIDLLKSMVREGHNFSDFVRWQDNVIKRADKYFWRN